MGALNLGLPKLPTAAEADHMLQNARVKFAKLNPELFVF
jgi:hypothetical protein